MPPQLSAHGVKRSCRRARKITWLRPPRRPVYSRWPGYFRVGYWGAFLRGFAASAYMYVRICMCSHVMRCCVEMFDFRGRMISAGRVDSALELLDERARNRIEFRAATSPARCTPRHGRYCFAFVAAVGTADAARLKPSRHAVAISGRKLQNPDLSTQNPVSRGFTGEFCVQCTIMVQSLRLHTS